jgi:F0F1-type ATP synthase alpha subunit
MVVWTGVAAESLDSSCTSLVLQAIDVLTPLGRGQAQLLTGPPGSGKTLAAVDAILGQVSN